MLLICSLFLLGVACSQDDWLTSEVKSGTEKNLVVKEKISVQNVAFQESTGYWLHKKGDPYTLANFRRVYDDILAGKYKELTRAEVNAVSETEELTATHYSVKFFPKTEAEQWQLERMEDINISYYPFEYALLSEEQVEELNVTRSAVNTLPDETRYTVTYDNLRTIEGPAPPQTFTLPVLYVVWPVDKPFPAGMDYEIVEELYIPDYSAESKVDPEVNAMLETRSFFPPNIIINPGDTLPRPTLNLRGQLMNFDSTLMRAVPITGVKVVLRNGSSLWNAITDSQGYFSFTAAVHLNLATVECWLQNTNWKVIRNTGSTEAFIFSMGDASNHWSAVEDVVPVWTKKGNSKNPLFLVARSIDHYYRGYNNQTHEIPGWTYSNGGLKVYVPCLPDEENNYAGLFYPAYGGEQAYIKIFNTRQSDLDDVGTVFHELGHFVHYCERGATTFNDMHSLLKESIASYVGDYLVRNHYTLYGGNYDDNPQVIAQARQSWNLGEEHIYYTPLFVDLFDSYNQHTGNSNRPVDLISTFSHEAMLRILRECYDWPSCKQILQSYVGEFYTQSELNTNLSDYDYYYFNNL